MIKIISFKICPFVQRVTASLAAKKIPYAIEYISLKDKPQWFLDISPNGQVPVMISENGTALFESDAIIEYIEDEYGAIEPHISNEQRALDRAWSYLASKNYLAQCGTMSSRDKATFEQGTKKLVAVFSKVERQLSGDSLYFKSNQLSNVDIAWLPLLYRAGIVKKYTDYDLLCGFPKTQAWQTALLNLDIIEQTVSEDFEFIFKDFYLKNTFLGSEQALKHPHDCNTSSCCG